MSNPETAGAMRAHHAEMAAELNARTSALASDTDWTAARKNVVSYLLDDVLPHAQAEESTIYKIAMQYDSLSSLVQSMIWEHTIIRDLSHALANSANRDEALVIAGQAAQLFWVHAEKENRFIIAMLESRADVDLDGLLGAMRDSLAG